MIGKTIGIGVLLFVCFAGWWLGGVLSKDALSLALGVLFGTMAGIPAALIAMSAQRVVRHEHVHRVELPETARKPVERISVLPASNTAQLGQNARNRTVLVGTQPRIEVSE